MANLVLGAGGAAAEAYTIDQSLRFNAADDPYLSRTPGSASNRTTWTWSSWIKKDTTTSPGGSPTLLYADNFQFFFRRSGHPTDPDTLYVHQDSAVLVTTQLFRDPSSWYHIVLAVDTTQGTDSNRVKLYVNGDQVTAFATASYPSEDAEWDVNDTTLHTIGSLYSGSADDSMGGYLAEVYLIDGQQLTPSSFGETDSATNQWKPIDASGLTFGTNGFYQKYAATELANSFEDSSHTWTCPAGVSSVEVLVVGGGGGAGGLGGGGGAGGVVHNSSYAVTAGVEYDITVGAGGATVDYGPAGNNGADSVFNVNAEGSGSAITALGGGYGSGGNHVGGDGGSGGGGNGGYSTVGGSGTQADSGGGTGYGNDGGDAGYPAAGGGGGANAVGTDYSGTTGGSGGAGKLFSTFVAYGTDSSNSASTGSNGGYFGGGGGGGAATGNTGGAAGSNGGGGAGTSGAYGASGLANTGGGAGGGNTGGGSGGSGVVLIDDGSTITAYTSTGSGHTITAVGDAANTRAQKKVGDSSIYFDGNDHLSIPPSQDFNFGSGDFTVEMWVYFNSITTTNKALWSFNEGDTDTVLKYTPANGIAFYQYPVSGSSWNFSQGSASGWATGTWYHIALVRNGTAWVIYRDGISVATHTGSETLDYKSRGLSIGATEYTSGVDEELDGYIDEHRTSKGIARYTEAFDPPTTEFTSDAYTVLLIHSNWDGGLGADSSGNFNTFSANNLVATDQMVDSPTNNFCTINPLANFYAGATLTEGNLKQSGPSANTTFTTSTFAPVSGKWYCEFYVTTGTTTSAIGISSPPSGSSTYLLGDSGYAYGYLATGDKRHDSSSSSYGSTWTTGDVMAIALDLDNNKLYFAKNNTWQDSGVPTSGATGTGAISILAASAVSFSNSYLMCVGHNTAGADSVFVSNFGQDSSFAGAKTAQGNQDVNSVGDFFYEPPTDFLALCTSSLSDDLYASIKKPGTNFNTVIYSGNSADDHNITGVGFEPDFVWIKDRNVGPSAHYLVDSVRGLGSGDSMKVLASNSTDPQYTTMDDQLVSFDTDGFTVNDNTDVNFYVNITGENYVSWNWLAATTFDPATDGTIVTASGRSNATAGFSIVKYTGTGSVATIGHGLAEAPNYISVKNLTDSYNWYMGSTILPNGWANQMHWNKSDYADANSTDTWNSTPPTASVFTVDSTANTNGSGKEYIAYCWHSVEGYSKIGRYEGNGELPANAPFIYCGFRPAWVTIKGYDIASRHWMMYDNKRSPYNVVDDYLETDTSDTEATGSTEALDFLSNGFRIRSDQAQINGTRSCLFLAFAESPFKYANAR